MINRLLSDKFNQFLIIFLLISHIFFDIFFPISLSVDSFEYLGFAKNFNPFQEWTPRNAGYPFFLKILFSESFMGISIVIFVQSIIHMITILLIYNYFKNYFNIYSVKIVTLIFLLNPFYFYASKEILADNIFCFSILLIVIFFFRYNNFKSIQNFLYLIFFIFISVLIRPSTQILFHILIFYLLVIKTINLNLISNKFFVLKIIVCFASIFLYKNITPQALVQKPYFNIWQFHAAHSFCENDDVRETKCINKNLGPKTAAYFNYLKTLIQKDKLSRNIISSKYGTTGSPERILEETKKMNLDELIEFTHKREEAMLFMHIWWRFNAFYGHSKTTSIFKGVIKELIILKPEILTKMITKSLSDISVFKKNCSNYYCTADLYYWVIQSVSDDLKIHSSTWKKTSKEVFVQNLYYLNKLSGNDISSILNLKSKSWLVTKKLVNKTFEDQNKLNTLMKNKNFGVFLSVILTELTNIFSKFYIILIYIFPLIFLFGICSQFRKKKSIKIIIKKYLIHFLLYITCLASLFITFLIVQGDRHIFMNSLFLILPLLIIFEIVISNLSNFNQIITRNKK